MLHTYINRYEHKYETNNILSIYYNIFPYYIYIYTLIVINISLLCL